MSNTSYVRDVYSNILKHTRTNNTCNTMQLPTNIFCESLAFTVSTLGHAVISQYMYMLNTVCNSCQNLHIQYLTIQSCTFRGTVLCYKMASHTATYSNPYVRASIGGSPRLLIVNLESGSSAGFILTSSTILTHIITLV